MLRETEMWKSAAFVISRDDVNRNTSISDSGQRRKRLIRQAGNDARAIENISTVHDDIDGTVERRLQRGTVVGEKVVSATTTLDAWAHRKVETEMRVREKQDPDDVAHEKRRGR